MDSLSQAALGASVGHLVLGRRGGVRAAAWGAVIATLPDLDVFVPMGNDVLDFTAHRSASHSLPLMALAAPLLAAGLARLHRSWQIPGWRWGLMVLLCLWTHSLLDAFTAYGTQLFWPLGTAPVAWSTIFIIDPGYTVPLCVGLLVALLRPQRAHWNRLGLLVSSAYLVWTVAVQAHVTQRARQSLQTAGHPVEAVLSSPAPFNTLLWRVLAMHEDGDYFEGFYSLADGAGPGVNFTRYAGGTELLVPIQDSWAVSELQWFTRGYIAARQIDSLVVVNDLRMGFEPFYVFAFAVGEITDGRIGSVEGRRLATRGPALDQLQWVWRRIWDAPTQFDLRGNTTKPTESTAADPNKPIPPLM